MNRSDLWGSVPGIGAAIETSSRRFRWGREELGVIVPGLVSGAARDAGNTPTTVLRAGLLVGMQGTTGRLMQYGATATDGTGQVFGVLIDDMRMVDLDVANTDRFYGVLVAGPVLGSQLIGLDETARSSMAGRFLFDDRNFQSSITGFLSVVAKTVNYTVVNGTDSYKTFTNQGAAGALTFTLPTAIIKGQRWRFTAEANFAITVAAPAGKLIAFNNPAATSVSFSTAGQIVGGTFEVGINADGTKYTAYPIGSNTVTVA